MAISDQQRWLNLNNPYVYRNDNLRRLGFKSYRSYLASELWKGIRARVLERARGKCEKCSRPAVQVHHRAYDPATLAGESIHALTAACARCHRKAELGQSARGYDRLQNANASIYKRRRRAYYR